MRIIKKVLLILILSLCLMPLTVSADSSESNDRQLKDIISSINDKLSDSTDSDIQSILDDKDLNIKTPESVENIKPDSIISALWSDFRRSLKAPLVMLGRLIAVSLLCITVKSLCTAESPLQRVFTMMSILCTIMVIIDEISKSISIVTNSMEQINTYLVSYLPIFSSIVAVGGNAGGAGGYLAVMMLICEVMSTVSSQILLPFLSIVLAIIMISAINTNSGLTDIADTVKKCVTWGLGGIMTIFTGLLTVQSLTGSAADGVSTKAIKFAASSFIPVIGSSVSEAYSSVKSSLGVIRTSVGTLGIIVLFLIVMKPVIAILAVKLAVFVGKLINDIFANKEIAVFLKNVNSVLSIGLSIIIAYLIMFVTATSILMMTALNSGA